MHEVYGDEISIIYTNIAAIVCITLANMVPNRREEEINLEFTELSLAMKQAFVRYLSHEMRTPINVALVGLLMHQQYLEERELFTDECKETIADVKGAVDVALETLNEALNYEKLQSKVMALDKTREDPLSFVLTSTSMFKAPSTGVECWGCSDSPGGCRGALVGEILDRHRHSKDESSNAQLYIQRAQVHSHGRIYHRGHENRRATACDRGRFYLSNRFDVL
jgi:hypothetical protein